MSVAGLDVGNATSCVALARKRGVDVIMNAESKRETPAIVSFGEKMRAVGVEGAARLMMNVKNTVVQVKRLIGRKFSDPDVQKDIQGFMFKVSEAPDGGCLISVMYLNEPKQVTPEQVVATILKDLKGIAEADQGSAITDCVLSVPAFFGEAERRAMLTAAELSGLKCLRLMNELTAAALNWGIFKADLPEDQPLHVVFVDVGHSALQICIAAFKKGSMEIKAHTWDRSLGGRDLDAVLVEHFGKEFKAKTGLDITQNPKSRFRMATQVTKTRQMLTINPEAPISVECLMEDTDFRSDVTRDKFEELAAPILARAMKPCEDALAKAGITAADVAAVEMVGAASRTPAIVKTVADVFKQEPKRTMNSKECVSRGCSLQAAMLSPIFQVRHFDVKELYPFSVNIEFDKDDGPVTNLLFGAKVNEGVTTQQFLPSIKNVAFMKTDPFSVKVVYDKDCDIGGASRDIADFKVTVPHKVPEGATSVSCKVSFELDLHGLVRCTQATHCHKIEVTEDPPAPAAAPKADAAAPVDTSATGEGAAKAEGENGDASNMDTDAPVGPPKPEDAKPAPVKKLKKVSQEAAFTQVFLTDLSKDTKHRLLEEEGQMAAADSLQRATDEAKNALEEYVYALRSKVQGECAPFAKEADSAALVAELNELENWLYEDGEDEKKSVYESKHTGLKAKGDPIVMRSQEAQTREAAVQQLSNKCQHGLQWVTTAPNEPKLAHVEASEIETVKQECNAALTWLEGKNSAQAALAKFDDPAVLTHELIQRAQALDNVVVPIMTKPVPPPPKPAEPEKPAADADKADKEAAPMEEDTPAAAEAAAGAGAPSGDTAPMEEP